jgi:hypothetical protein
MLGTSEMLRHVKIENISEIDPATLSSSRKEALVEMA